MAITKTTTPYEFLVRWNEGILAGAHIRFLETIKDGDAILTQKEGHAMPVEAAGNAGFPLGDILSPLQAQALVERDAAIAAKAAAEAQATTLQTQLDAKTAELTAAQARIAELEGNPVTPPTAGTVTMRQARLALLQAGLLANVEAAINAMDEPAKTAARIEWDYSNELQRSHPLVSQLGAALGLTDAQLDQLFAAAAAL